MLEEWPLRLRIEQAGAAVLHRPAREVSAAELQSPELQRVIDLMFVTLSGVGVGLAAPQIGLGLQVVVIEDPPSAQVLVPPQLLAELDHLGGRLYLERMLPRTFVSAASAAQHWTRMPIGDARAALGQP